MRLVLPAENAPRRSACGGRSPREQGLFCWPLLPGRARGTARFERCPSIRGRELKIRQPRVVPLASPFSSPPRVQAVRSLSSSEVVNGIPVKVHNPSGKASTGRGIAAGESRCFVFLLPSGVSQLWPTDALPGTLAPRALASVPPADSSTPRSGALLGIGLDPYQLSRPPLLTFRPGAGAGSRSRPAADRRPYVPASRSHIVPLLLLPHFTPSAPRCCHEGPARNAMGGGPQAGGMSRGGEVDPLHVCAERANRSRHLFATDDH